MSQPVDLSTLAPQLLDYGTTAYLVTVNDDGSAHVVSALVRAEGTALVTGVGRRTRANLERSPAVTLLWPTAPDPAYSLIVDATFTGLSAGVSVVESAGGLDDEVMLAPFSAVLHRIAGSVGDGPTCLPLPAANSEAPS